MRRTVVWALVVPMVLVLTGCAAASSGGTAEGGAAGPATSGNVASTDVAGLGPVSDTGVEGRVTTPEGDPVVSATVDRQPLGNAGPVSQKVGVTGDDGRYFWALTPGDYEITVTAPGWQPASETVSVTSGSHATLNFVLQPANR
jgi:protocatechuate 3,4-dioxygenase beta subunit